MKISVKKWVFWCFNFGYDFIEKAWADQPLMAQHFRSKFNHICETYGADAAMNRFYTELSDTNREILERYVSENYHG